MRTNALCCHLQLSVIDGDAYNSTAPDPLATIMELHTSDEVGATGKPLHVTAPQKLRHEYHGRHCYLGWQRAYLHLFLPAQCCQSMCAGAQASSSACQTCSGWEGPACAHALPCQRQPLAAPLRAVAAAVAGFCGVLQGVPLLQCYGTNRAIHVGTVVVALQVRQLLMVTMSKGCVEASGQQPASQPHCRTGLHLYAQHLFAPQQIKLKLSLKSTYCFHCLAYTSSSQAQLLLRTVA